MVTKTKVLPKNLNTQALERDFVKSFKPFYYAMKMFGLAPYCFDIEMRVDTTFTSNVFSLIWSVLLLILVVFQSALSLICAKKLSLFEELATVTRISLLLLTFASIIPLISINVTHRNKFRTLFENLWIVDKNIFYEAPVNKNYKTMRKIIFMEIILLVTFAVLACIDSYIWAFARPEQRAFEIGTRFLILLCTVTYVVYCNVAYLIYNRLISVRKRLEIVLNQIEKIGVTDGKYFSCLEFSNNSEEYADRQKVEISTKILSLRHTYSKIYGINKCLNSMLGLYVVFEMIYNFLSFVSHTYIGVIHFKYLEVDFSLHDASLLMWILFHLVKQGIMCVICDLSYSETNGLQETVQNIILRVDNYGIQQQAQLFSTQISRSKIYFSAAGFYELNRSLFYNSVSSAVSFIVLLIQFRRDN